MERNDLLIMSAGLLVGAGLAIILYFGLGFADRNSDQDEGIAGVSLPESAAVGHPAPDFELNTLMGESVKLSELRGKIVLINFWATWCEPCKVEMPFFEKLYQEPGSELEILAVNFDESPQVVSQFIDELGLNFPILLDPGGIVQNLYRVRGYPTTFVIDKTGVVQFHHIGLFAEDQLSHYLDQLGENE